TLDNKRLELLEMKRGALTGGAASPEIDAQLAELSERIRAYQAPKRAPDAPKDLLKLGKKRADGGLDRIDLEQPRHTPVAAAKDPHHHPFHVDLSAPDISPAEPTVVELHMPAAE
ncbi:MAG: hypothetical protein ACXVCJ_29265, partial [Polyangiales bacterium]